MTGEGDWDTFVARHAHGNLLQTAGWAALKSQFGWQAKLSTLTDGGGLVAGAQVLTRWLPPRALRWASINYLPRGPLVDWGDPAQVSALLGRIVADARRQRAIMVRIEPDLLVDQVAGFDELLLANNFRPSRRAIQPRRTILVDIHGEEDEIRARMKQKTRYNIRLAQRKGVTVREGAPADLAAFSQLMHITGERNAIGVHSEAYYRAAYALFAPAGQASLLLAEYEGRPLAGLMVFALGKVAWYLYGASDNRERQRMPAYLLQWEAIRWARARGCELYDLWGVPDEDEDVLEANFTERSDGLWGVYRFKRGFGGRLVRTVGAYDCVLNRPFYRVLSLFERD